MKYATLLVFTVLLFLSSPVAQEGQGLYNDGNRLLPRCKAAVDGVDSRTSNGPDDAFGAGYCFGLVNGIGYGSPRVCPANNVTKLQEVRVVVKYLEDNPQILNLNESVLTENALSKAFPCPK